MKWAMQNCLLSTQIIFEEEDFNKKTAGMELCILPSLL